MALNTNYFILTEPESTIAQNADYTIDNPVGICYFDQTDESLKEISTITDHIFSVQPYRKSIKKYYLVIDDASSITTISVTPVFTDTTLSDDPSDYFSIKTIISQAEPTLSELDDLDSLNTASITGFSTGEIYNIYILVENIKPLNQLLDVALELEYE